MTILIDTHCHLADPAFDGDRDAVLARARAAGVGHVVAVGESPERAEQVRTLARRHASVSATAGLHPHDARRWSPELAQRLEEALADPVVVAVGETGLDYHYDNSPRPEQRQAFDAQLELATRTGKPAVIHAREADDDVSAILRSHPRAVAILHSFSSGRTLFHTAVTLGHYVSWSGMVTFRNWNLDDLVREVPEDRLLVETDAPYLAPVPYRGTRNEPAFVRAIAERVAEVVGWDVEECIARTGANARRVFGARVAIDDQRPTTNA
ncbi:MAG TPA: TatD family hydrolase [Gemmatimonadales bacterium]